jgi:hypothetical protein
MSQTRDHLFFFLLHPSLWLPLKDITYDFPGTSAITKKIAGKNNILMIRKWEEE